MGVHLYYPEFHKNSSSKKKNLQSEAILTCWMLFAGGAR